MNGSKETEVIPLEIPPPRGMEGLPEDLPEEPWARPLEWCEDLEAEIKSNAGRAIQAIMRNDASLQTEMDDMASEMKAKLEKASKEQKEHGVR
jgi:hypothetical protein